MNPQNTGFKLVVAVIATVITYPLFSFIGSGEFIVFKQLGGANLSFSPRSRPKTQADFTVEPIKPEGMDYKATEEPDRWVLEAELRILDDKQSRDPTKLEDPEHNYKMAWFLYKLVKKTAPTDDETSRANYIATAYRVATKAHDLYKAKEDEKGREKSLGLMSSIEDLASTYDVSLLVTGGEQQQQQQEEKDDDWDATVRKWLEEYNRKVAADIETKQARLDELYAMIEADPAKGEDAEIAYELAWLHCTLSKTSEDALFAMELATKAYNLYQANGDEEGMRKADNLKGSAQVLAEKYAD